MTLPGKLCVGILEEDNPQKSYFRFKPLLVAQEDGYAPFSDGAEAFAEAGCLRIVPDKNESGHFKPTKASLDAVKETLDYLSVPTQNIHFYDVEKDKEALKTYKKQCAGGKIQGWDECL